MPKNVLSTTEILAFRRLGREIDSDWVDWAVSMLMAGSDTPSLRILAGEVSPFNPFEMVMLVERVFDELGLVVPPCEKDAVRSLTAFWVQQLLAHTVSIDVALSKIAELCIELDYEESIHDFYLLSSAYEDIQMSETQWHWPYANPDNIESVIYNYCQEWFDKYSVDI